MSIVHRATTVMCASEPITAEPTATPTLRNKQIYTCSGVSWRFSPVLFCASKLTVVY